MKKAIIRLIGAAIVAALAVVATSFSQGTRIAISLIVGLPSLVLLIISRRQLGSSFATTPQAKALVTTGLYVRIQHPMYLFLDLFLAWFIVILSEPILLLAWGILVVVQVIQAHREEKVLSAAFGAAYETYKNHTWI